MKRRILAICMILALLTGCGAETAPTMQEDTAIPLGQGEQAEEGIPVTILDVSAEVLVSEDPSEYPNDEVFVGYTDGTFEILTFENDDELANALEQLSQDETVTLIQPNYSYESNDVMKC